MKDGLSAEENPRNSPKEPEGSGLRDPNKKIVEGTDGNIFPIALHLSRVRSPSAIGIPRVSKRGNNKKASTARFFYIYPEQRREEGNCWGPE